MPYGSIICWLLAIGLVGVIVSIKQKWLTLTTKLSMLLVAVILALVGFNAYRISIAEAEQKIAIEHKGHEALHAQLRADLEAVEYGDIIEISDGVWMFAMSHRRSGNVELRRIYASAESDILSIDWLVLAHAKVLKLGTPEYLAALGEEAKDYFNNLRKQK